MRKHGLWSKSLVYDLEAEQVHHGSSHERTNLGQTTENFTNVSYNGKRRYPFYAEVL